MRIVMLGATGFVGKNVLPLLVEAGIEVYAVTRELPEASSNVRNGVHWVRTPSLLDGSSFPHFDAIISVAGVGNPSSFEINPTAALAAEKSIADLVADLTVRFKIGRTIYLSTAGAAYGDGWRNGERIVFNETDLCSPISAYGKAKLSAEQRLMAHLNDAMLLSSVAIIRATNIYGHYYTKGGRQGLVNALVEQARQREPITIYGDGQIYRDYLYSGDLADALIKSIQSDAAGIFNIGAGLTHSILEVVSEVEKVAGRKFERKFLPSRGFDAKYAAVSIEKARTLLGWTPTVELTRGIELLLLRQSEEF